MQQTMMDSFVVPEPPDEANVNQVDGVVTPSQDDIGTRPARTRTLHLSNYLVIYIDLLGQSAELEKVRRLPTTDREKESVRAAVKLSAERVCRIRNTFNELVTDLTSAHAELQALVVPERRQSFLKLQPQINQIGFSDTFVVSVPLQKRGELEDAARSASAVWNVLAGVAGISLAALAQAVPLRGGLEVGAAVELFPQEVYGAVLLAAYRLESQVAEYPRTAVGPDLFRYLAYLEQLPQDTPFNVYASGKAHACREFVCNGPDDGRPMLHILSPAIIAAAPEYEPYRVPAQNWVTSQVDRYRKEENQKLADRYVRLARYFETYI